MSSIRKRCSTRHTAYQDNREEAEDMLQEAFTDCFRNIGSYRTDSTFGAWLKIDSDQPVHQQAPQEGGRPGLHRRLQPS
ncbi:MAG: hypothetical protein MZV63_54540 [Marinilabiliales bacterium]|nr:hypothetical protein [Marinilabiliales bacterium]